MRKQLVDFKLFQYALTSAEHGSFRRAAAAMNVQQSTVSRGVRNLELRVGAELFERSHAGIRPTPAGDQFLREATLGFDHLRRAMRQAAASQRGEEGELAVGASVPFTLFGELFERFRKKHAGVELEMIENTTSASSALVQQRRVDVAIVAKLYENGGVQSLHLGEEPMLAVLPRSHSQAGARRLSIEELRQETFILSASGLGPDIRDHLTRRMTKSGTEPRVQLHRASQCDLINMVASGFGVTIVVGRPRATIDGVVFIPLAGRSAISMWAIWMDSNPNPALKALLNVAQERTTIPRQILRGRT
ncbi:LysR family transcriptional regulator [Rhizobium leguminosarum]|uniref:LysR family transcriptional regulator n=1 Tax=Rhizobium leguminosarum TaxID=384 RepID=UPI001442211B|nr:LysR family transcriptional regulator [Rhizobium leguminosarum]MBY5836288.1 LysR family transcriptional regulator [Rhizobium leguminosarum]NKM79020.1 LysR family transcriptional regulator [Rhizobium leguminosarum bv. viciae]QSZ08606.1 LysR family transcriptional regulator [Rhizobium leguminosarum]